MHYRGSTTLRERLLCQRYVQDFLADRLVHESARMDHTEPE